MKYVTAFFMAWGNFLKIPCPVKKWDEKLNKLKSCYPTSVMTSLNELRNSYFEEK